MNGRHRCSWRGHSNGGVKKSPWHRGFTTAATTALTPDRLNTVLSHATTPTQRVQAARKMGVGRGEFDLALKLKSMAEAKKEAQR